MSLPHTFFIGRGGASGPVGETAATAGTVAQMFAAGNPAGIYWHAAVTGIRFGNPFQVRYKPYGGKGWVNTFITQMPNPADDDNWAYSSNAGWDQQQGSGAGFYLKTVNLGTNSLVTIGNAYSASCLLLGPNWGATDFMCTSVNTNSEANLVATVSGNNSGGALPLVASTDMKNGSGSVNSNTLQAKAEVLNYFTGVESGFDFGAGYTPSAQTRSYDACWYKSGPNGQQSFGMLMHNRQGPQTDHWMIANTSQNGNAGSTYLANIGYRGSTGTGGWVTWDSANIGSWAQYNASGAPTTAFATAPQRIGPSNAISIWLSNM